MQLIILSSLAAIGGLAGLIFELVLFKALSVQLGTTHTALAIVLAAYMAGFGLGTAFFGRFRVFSWNDRTVLIISQVLAGVLVAFCLGILHILDKLIVTFKLSVTVEYLLIFLAIIPPVFCMGALVPLLYKLGYRTGAARGPVFSWIFGMNSAGSVVGVLLATFILVPGLGLTVTNYGATLFLFCVALGIWAVRPTEQGLGPDSGARDELSEREISWIGLASMAGIAGFCGLALEIVWVRILGTFLPNRTYSFGLVLAIYLLGYALGSLTAGPLLKKRRRPISSLPLLFLVLGLMSLGTVSLITFIPDVMYLLRDYLASSWRQIIVPPVFMSFLMVFPATFFMGLVLPFLVAFSSVERQNVGYEVGYLYGTNILCSIAGSLLAGFVGLPVLGVARTALIVGILYAGVALTILLRQKNTTLSGRILLFVSGGILCISCLGLIKPGFLPKPTPVSVGREESRDDKLLFFKETAAGTITVVEDARTNIRWSYINNSAVCGTTYDALKAVRMLAHLPLLAHAHPEQVLIIGFGLGVTAGNVLTYPVSRVDCVELCPELVEAAPLYQPFNGEVLTDPRLTVHAGDGRRWLKRSDRKFDVITCDPTHPVLGSGNLYTREYFQLVRDHLTEQGTFVQYYPFRYLTTDELKSALATFLDVFPHAYLWLGYSHGVMLGCAQPLKINPTVWQQALSDNPRRFDLLRSSLSRTFDWLALLLMGPAELKEFCGQVRPVLDTKPILEYPRFSSVHPYTWADNMSEVSARRSVESVQQLIISEQLDDDFMATLDRFYQGQTLLIQGNIERARGRVEAALELFLEARTTNWDDTEIRSVHEFLQEQLGQERKRRYLGQQ
ncbi:fused MFS/spermidine synthase [bacterium]|nr:fused MFS/spermidine synthase [bacterium]